MTGSWPLLSPVRDDELLKGLIRRLAEPENGSRILFNQGSEDGNEA